MESSALVKYFYAAAVMLVLLGVGACRPSEDTTNEIISKQIQTLQEMECEPHYHKFNASDLIPSHNELKNKHLLTNVVALRRCSDSCSYCGNRRGREVKKCLPTEGSIEEVKVVVWYLEDGERKTDYFRAEEHTKCECQMPKEDGR